jgi:S1-C subfamily serine protease
MPRYDDDDFDRPRRHTTPAAGSSGVVPWVLVGVLAVALLAAGVGLFAVWPKGAGKGTDPDAQGREVTPKSPPDGEEAEAVNLFKSAKDSVVNVDTVVFRRNLQTRSTDVVQAGTGSGFVWDDEGRVVTNYHVIREAIKNRLTLRVVLADRSEWKVTVVGVAPEYDLAVLKINAPPAQLKKIKVGTSRDLEVGQKVYAIGNPFGLSLTLTKGIVSALDREMDSPVNTPITGVIQTDAPINPGNSGGPLLDREGKLIGVNTAIASPSGGNVGIGFAIPVDTVNEIATVLIRDGKLVRPDAGIRLVDQNILFQNGIRNGAMVAQVLPGGPAAATGLVGVSPAPNGRYDPGDLITAVDGVPVANNVEFLRAIAKRKPGDSIKLTVERNNTSRDVDLTLRGV